MKKIAILGGGVGAMTAAWALTNDPGWRDEYEITVYQLGWRLGGKGASGRNAREGQRIEEHGLHVWLGFYNNAFQVMQECYRELGRPAGAPLRTWEDAFRPHSAIVLEEFVEGAWQAWPITMPVTSGVPGEGGALPSPAQYVEMVMEGMLEALIGPTHELALEPMLEDLWGPKAPAWMRPIEAVERWVASRLAGRGGKHRAGAIAWLAEHLHSAREGAHDVAALDPAGRDALVTHLDGFLERLRERALPLVEKHALVRRLFVLMDLGVSVARGLVRDGALAGGFAVLEDVEFRDWLRRHGASDLALSSAPVRAVYDLCFAFEDGDVDRPNMAAGTALHIALAITFAYKGAVMYKMQAGMGDTVFTPLHQVLERRGVRFEFFHRVRRLELNADGTAVAAIHVDRQVHLADGRDRYDPYVVVKGLPCWPSEPLYDQLREGAALRERGVNLESHWAEWTPVEERTLARGRDFDLVVLGISVGALAEIGAELVAARPAWARLVQEVRTVETQAVQLWLRPSLAELGWTGPSPISGTYAEPLDTWADMSDLLVREDWPGEGPRTIAYFCGPKPGGAVPPASARDYPTRQEEAVRASAVAWFASNVGAIWPKATSVGNPAGLDPRTLHAPPGGGDPWAHQYRRANVDPSERYVMSVAGSSRHRLRAGRSGVANLFLAGDWVFTPLNAGCVEAAAMAGLAAARAICGRPARIVGWDDPEGEG